MNLKCLIKPRREVPVTGVSYLKGEPSIYKQGELSVLSVNSKQGPAFSGYHGPQIPGPNIQSKVTLVTESGTDRQVLTVSHWPPWPESLRYSQMIVTYLYDFLY